MAQADDIEVQGWGDNELRSGQDHGSRSFSIQDCSRAQKQSLAQFLPDPAEHVESIRNRHGDLDHVHAAVGQSASHLHKLIAVRSAHHRHDARIQNVTQLGFGHDGYFFSMSD